jgi:DNA polymerase
MRVRDLARYCRDLGWRDAPNPPEETLIEKEAPQSECVDLASLAQRIEGCTRCRLSERRRNVVVGEGASSAPVMFIGEGPGAEEDRTGRPFVGQAGRLLDGMILALGFKREDVYIGNVVKCRPPDNRDPQEDEMAACSSYLQQQIQLIQPQIIVALGRVAARHLTGTTKPMGALRGRWTSYRGIPLLPMYHPAYLLRNPKAKRETWQDLKAVRARLDLPNPSS